MMERAPAVVRAVQGSALMLREHPDAHVQAMRRTDAYLASVAACLRDPAMTRERDELVTSWDAGAARLLDWLRAEWSPRC